MPAHPVAPAQHGRDHAAGEVVAGPQGKHRIVIEEGAGRRRRERARESEVARAAELSERPLAHGPEETVGGRVEQTVAGEPLLHRAHERLVEDQERDGQALPRLVSELGQGLPHRESFVRWADTPDEGAAALDEGTRGA
jgi:hypothetical protein